VFNDSDYKAGSAPVLKYGALTEYDKVYCSGKYNSDTIELTPSLQAQVLAAYEKDYNNLTFDEVLNTYPLGTIEMRTYDSEEYIYGTMSSNSYSGDLVIYPSYTNTLKVLNDNGFDMTFDITVDDVKSLFVDYYEVEEHNEGIYTYTSSSPVLDNVQVTDKEQISTILANIENQNFNWYTFSNLLESENKDHYEIYVGYYDSDKNEDWVGTYEFRKGCVPEFMAALGE
jgi:hypothetical protein